MAEAPDFILLRRDLAAPLPPLQLPTTLRIEPVEVTDAREAHALLQSAYATGFGWVPDDWLVWWESVAGDSEFDRDLCLVAREADRMVGFCLCWTSSFVKDLAVTPDRQGHGLGRTLLLVSLSHLKSRGATGASLKVRTANTTARRLYERLGFLPSPLRGEG